MILNNLIGFETGDLSELNSYAGTPTITQSPVARGKYAVNIIGPAVGTIIVDKVKSGTNSGNSYILGFDMYLESSTLTPGTNSSFLRFADPAGNRCLYFKISNIGGVIYTSIWNASDTLVQNGTIVIPTGAWTYIEILWDNTDTGKCVTRINGTQDINIASADFFNVSSASVYRFYRVYETPMYLDSIYCGSGATTADFRGRPNQAPTAYLMNMYSS